MKIYTFTSYRDVIKQKISESSQKRGYQGLLAKVAGCQPSYFSRILRNEAELSLEQALKLAGLWHFSEDETNYFLGLVNYDKTQYAPLKIRIERNLEKLRNDSQDLTKKYAKIGNTADSDYALYYSVWYMSAVHILTSIPQFSTVDKICEHLSLSRNQVEECLCRLEEMGLVRRIEKKWKITGQHLYTERTSPLTTFHHQNWRQRAVIDSQKSTQDHVHYTLVQSHNADAYRKIKAILSEAIEESRKIVETSPEEELSCMTIDLFHV